MALIVKKSQIPNAGKGLYTTKSIKSGTRVIEYKGEVINWKEYKRRVEKDQDGYLFHFSDDYCLDAYHTPEHKARYSNDAEGITTVEGLTNNCEYEVDGLRCFVLATKDIEAGEEIFVSYSKEYWDCIRYNINLQNKELEKELVV